MQTKPKKHLLITFNILLLVLFSSPILAQPDNSLPKELTLLADSWCPYNCDIDSKSPGFVIEITRTIMEKHGIKVKYIAMNWLRAVKEAERGAYDGLVASTKSDTPNFIFPDEEQGVLEYRFFIRKGSSTTTGIEEKLLSSLVLGVIRGYHYEPTIDEYIQKNHNSGQVIVAHGVEPLVGLAKMLINKRIDALIEDQSVAHLAFNRLNLRNKISTGHLVTRKNVYIAFSPSFPHAKKFAKLLSKGMKDIRQSGELKKVLDKYGISDWK